MHPTRAMGTFLRTWREQWAGLSRAQLATAVSALCTNGKGVTTGIVRLWEDGQPPKTEEEFEGLCQVMRTRGLSTREVRHFREAVLAAVCDRQYPGLFGPAGLAHRDDLPGIAHAAYVRHFHYVFPISVVQLVATIHELETCLSDGTPAGMGNARLRRQAEALPYLWALVGAAHAHGGRGDLAAEAHSAAAACLETHFGREARPGPDYRLTTLGQRFAEAVLRLQALDEALAAAAPSNSTRARKDLRLQAQRGRWLGRLLAIAEEAKARGELRLAAQGRLAVVKAEPVEADLFDQTWPELGRLMDEAEWVSDDAQFERCTALVAAGKLDEAERGMEGLERWEERAATLRCQWHELAGRLALAQGQVQEAWTHFERGYRVAESDELAFFVRSFARGLEACESMRSTRQRARR